MALSIFLWCARQPNYFHDRRSFELMVPVLCRLTERFGSVRDLVGELESIGCLIKAQTFMILLRISWYGNLYEIVHEVFDEMHKRNFVPNTFARNIALDIMFKHGRFDQAMRFFRLMRLPNFLSYNIVLRNQCSSNLHLEALETFREMIKKGFNLNTGTLIMVLHSLSKTYKFAELKQLLGFMIVSGKELAEAVWTILIDSLCRAGKADTARALVQKIIESGCQPTVVAYTSLIKGLLEAQMEDEAFVMLDTMLSSNCNPDLIFYNVLIHTLSNAGRYNEAIDVFQCLPGTRLRPDSYTLASLIKTSFLLGQTRLLPELVVGWQGSFDIVVYNILIHAFCKAGCPSQAVKFFKDLKIKGFKPDSYTYAGLLSGLCMQGKIGEAVRQYDVIILNEPNIDAYVHTAILSGLVKQRLFHLAIMLFRRAMREKYCLDVVSYTIAIDALFECHMFREACFLFEQMKHSGIVPNIITDKVVHHGLCKARYVGAIDQLRWMKYSRTTYSPFLDPLVSRRLAESNRSLLSYVEESVSDSESDMPKDLLVCCAS